MTDRQTGRRRQTDRQTPPIRPFRSRIFYCTSIINQVEELITKHQLAHLKNSSARTTARVLPEKLTIVPNISVIVRGRILNSLSESLSCYYVGLEVS